MRYTHAHKEQTRSNILNAALCAFRTEGYHGIGVDGIAKNAGVTSGAFYKHFNSKSDAFRSVVSEGLKILRNAIADNQKNKGAKWLSIFIKWYFSLPSAEEKASNCAALPMEGGCALPTLSPEIARTDPETQKLFEQEIRKIAATISSGLPGGIKNKSRISWTVLSLMVGGVVLARAVYSEKTSADISRHIVATINQISR